MSERSAGEGRPRLATLDIRPAGEGVVLRLETDRGEAIEVEASYDQLDSLADHLDDVLQDGPGAD